MNYLLDTTAVSAAMRHDADIERFLSEHAPGDVVTAPPVVAEIEYGIRRLEAGSRRRRLLERESDRVFGPIRVVEWLPGVASRFGAIKAYLEKAGTPIDDFDVLIAAFALEHGAKVVTANQAHFSRVPDLSVVGW